MQCVKFDVGEQRHVKLLIHAVDDAPFVVRKAGWKLMWAGESEASGVCEIDGHVIDALITPKKRTVYRLIFEYEIADEILIEQIEVRVE